MTSRMKIYFMALVGASSGLVSWALVTLLTLVFAGVFAEPNLLDAINMTLLGVTIGGMAVGFSDYWAEGRVLLRWVMTGMGIGLVVGLSGGLLAAHIQPLLGEQSALLGRVIPWTLVGELIGFGVGIRWFNVNLHTPLLSTCGGMIGATVGGLVFSLSGTIFPQLTDFIQASAFVCTGVGITTGITLAPQLLSVGILRFVSSSDPRAYSNARGSEWLLQDGDRLLIGSLSSQKTTTIYRKEVELFLSDSEIAPRHAYVFAQNGRFYIENHPDNTDPNGASIHPLKLRERPVLGIQELRQGDLITVGLTQIRFESKRRRSHGT